MGLGGSTPPMHPQGDGNGTKPPFSLASCMTTVHVEPLPHSLLSLPLVYVCMCMYVGGRLAAASLGSQGGATRTRSLARRITAGAAHLSSSHVEHSLGFSAWKDSIWRNAVDRISFLRNTRL
jgi:hypothetical protein